MSCLYIDADNISYKCMDQIYDNVKFNNLIIKKIYGDWSKTELKNWNSIVLDYGLEPIQCFRIGRKQSTDIKLITDLTNDICSNNEIKHIYLVTSDSDFTHVCQLIRKKSIKLTILSLQNTILENYANNYISLSSNKNFDDLDYLHTALCENYVMLLSKFKKELKEIVPSNYDTKKCIDNIKTNYYDYFMITKRKNKEYIIYIYDFVEYNKDNFLKNRDIIENNYKTIFLIIDFNELTDYLFCK